MVRTYPAPYMSGGQHSTSAPSAPQLDQDINEQVHAFARIGSEQSEAEFLKLKKENEEMKRQHTYDTAKMEFLDRTVRYFPSSTFPT